MKASKIHEILRNKQKVDIFYNERPVWIQEVNNDIAKIGFIDNFEEKNVHIEDLYEKTKYYLEHDMARQKIANAGYQCVKRDFTFENRLQCMFQEIK